jgi:flagellar biosynthesis GTPase FlhF
MEAKAPKTEPTPGFEYNEMFQGIYESGIDKSEKKEDEWYFGVDGSEEGPLSTSEMKDRISQGRISIDYFVWRDGFDNWIPIEEVKELVVFFRKQKPAKDQPVEPSGTESVDQVVDIESKHRWEEVDQIRKQVKERKQKEEEERKKEDKQQQKRRKELARAKLQEEQLRILREEKEHYQKQALERRQHRQAQEKKKIEEERRRQVAFSHALRKAADDHPDQEASRIAGHFFHEPVTDESHGAALPPPPVQVTEDVGTELAGKFARSAIEEEYEDLQVDPLAVLRRRDGPGKSDISKIIRVQAGLASRGRRFSVAFLTVVVVLGLIGGGSYLFLKMLGKKVGSEFDWSQVKTKQKYGLKDDIDYSSLSPEEAKRIREGLWSKPGKRGAKRRNGRDEGRRVLTDRKNLSQKEEDLMAFYKDEKKEEMVPRGPDLDSLTSTSTSLDLPTISTSPLGMPKNGVLPGKRESALVEREMVVNRNDMVQQQLRLHMRKKSPKIRGCLERQLKRDSSISGKMIVVVRVVPSGKVTTVKITPEKFEGSFIEECLTKEIRTWKFASFKGDTVDLTIPLLLQGR